MTAKTVANPIKLFMICVYLLIVLNPALAQDELNSGVAKCAAIAGDLDRLECFDELAKQAGLDAPTVIPHASSSGDPGKWNVRTSINPIDDSKTVTMFLAADSGRAGYDNALVTLIARCKSNKTEVYANFRTYLGDDSSSVYDEYKRVTIRVGTGAARTENWSVSTDNEAVFAARSIPLLKEMAKSQKLILQVTPYGDSPVTAVFDTKGLEVAAAPLADTCNWSF